MKALVYHGSGTIAWEERPLPKIEHDSDVIIRISKTTICGTDLAILKGGVATVSPGRIIGHEATGFVTEAGPAVQNFRVGDHVIIPVTSSCGRCDTCRHGLYSSCTGGGGWVLGNTLDGVQAEFARIPFADWSLHHIPPDVDEEAALMLADILPTGLEIGAQNARIALGDTVAVLGAGPVGLAVVIAAQLYSPSSLIVIDLDDNRLQLAKKLGATHIINNRDGSTYETVMRLTEKRGVDAAIEVIGNPATFDLAQQIVAVNGRIADVGIFSKDVPLHNERLWTRNLSLRMGVVTTNTIPALLKMTRARKLDPTPLISHRLPLTEIMHAYDLFRNAGKYHTVKIVLSNEAKPAQPAELAASTDAQLIRAIVERVMAEHP